MAKEMGLGKTLSTLALICWDLDAMADGRIGAIKGGRTLVVVPKSSKFGVVRWDDLWDRAYD